MTHHTLQTALDGLLHQTVHRHGGVPGVVAIFTHADVPDEHSQRIGARTMGDERGGVYSFKTGELWETDAD